MTTNSSDWDFLDLEAKETITSRFREEGFVCLRNLNFQQRTIIDQWLEWSTHHTSSIFEALHQNGHIDFPQPQRETADGKVEYSLKAGVKHGFREIVMRSPGRYEISVLDCKDRPPLQEIQDQLSTVIPSLLGEDSLDDLQLCHVSIVTASPSSTDQGWHADGGHVNLQQHLPCHCLNVFIPLVDVLTIENGPTELRPCSHFLTRNLAPLMLAAKARKTLRSPVIPSLQRRDVLIFDYRILHRGRANVSVNDRPILVLTYAKSWFKDILNFPKKSLYDREKQEDNDDC